MRDTWWAVALAFIWIPVASPASEDQALIAFLQLDEDQAGEFWPIHTEYRYDMAQLDAQDRRLRESAVAHAAHLDAMLADQFVEGWLEKQRDEVKLMERTVKRLRRVMNEAQVARWLMHERGLVDEGMVGEGLVEEREGHIR